MSTPFPTFHYSLIPQVHPHLPLRLLHVIMDPEPWPCLLNSLFRIQEDQPLDCWNVSWDAFLAMLFPVRLRYITRMGEQDFAIFLWQDFAIHVQYIGTNGTHVHILTVRTQHPHDLDSPEIRQLVDQEARQWLSNFISLTRARGPYVYFVSAFGRQCCVYRLDCDFGCISLPFHNSPVSFVPDLFATYGSGRGSALVPAVDQWNVDIGVFEGRLLLNDIFDEAKVMVVASLF